MRKLILIILLISLTSCTSLTKQNYVMDKSGEVVKTSPVSGMWNAMIGGVNYILDGDSPTTRVKRYKNKQMKKQLKEKAKQQKLEASLSN
jgi:hypothetical protein